MTENLLDMFRSHQYRYLDWIFIRLFIYLFGTKTPHKTEMSTRVGLIGRKANFLLARPYTYRHRVCKAFKSMALTASVSKVRA